MESDEAENGLRLESLLDWLRKSQATLNARENEQLPLEISKPEFESKKIVP